MELASPTRKVNGDKAIVGMYGNLCGELYLYLAILLIMITYWGCDLSQTIAGYTSPPPTPSPPLLTPVKEVVTDPLSALLQLW